MNKRKHPNVSESVPVKQTKRVSYLCLKNSFTDYDVILIERPTKRECQVIGRLQGKCLDDFMPYTIGTNKVVYDKDANEIGADDLWHFLLQGLNDEKKVQKMLHELFNDDSKDLQNKKDALTLLGGVGAFKDLSTRMKLTKVNQLPNYPLKTVFVCME